MSVFKLYTASYHGDHNLNIHCHGNLKYHTATPLVSMADKGYTAEVGTWFFIPHLKSYAGGSLLITTV
jgi:hypothetical protein